MFIRDFTAAGEPSPAGAGTGADIVLGAVHVVAPLGFTCQSTSP
jgi:hypothetical protein